MAISKKAFIDSWKRSIADLSVPSSSFEEVDEWEDITKAGSDTNYNAAVKQDGFGDEYSYEDGYFKAFKVITQQAKKDSDSLVMPVMFVARHLIELTLK